MTSVSEFYQKDCDKIDPNCVNAYLDISLKDNDPSVLVLDSSWGTDELDLEPAVKDAETVTTLKLISDRNPGYLEFHREDGEVDCISGDDLSRIIKFLKLADVTQTEQPSDGDVYIYNSEDQLFHPFNLKEYIDNTASTINNLGNKINQLEQAIDNINNALNVIQNLLKKPANVPSDVTVAWGNINNYGDITNTNKKTSGIYTHDPNVNKNNDQYFS